MPLKEGIVILEVNKIFFFQMNYSTGEWKRIKKYRRLEEEVIFTKGARQIDKKVAENILSTELLIPLFKHVSFIESSGSTIRKELLSKKFVENNVGKNLSMDPSRTFCQFVVSIESCRMDRTLVDIFYIKCRQI